MQKYFRSMDIYIYMDIYTTYMETIIYVEIRLFVSLNIGPEK